MADFELIYKSEVIYELSEKDLPIELTSIALLHWLYTNNGEKIISLTAPDPEGVVSIVNENNLTEPVKPGMVNPIKVLKKNASSFTPSGVLILNKLPQ